MSKAGRRQSELPIFQGYYQYYRNGERQPIDEPWAIYRDSKQQIRIQSARHLGSIGSVLSAHATACCAQGQSSELFRARDYSSNEIALKYSDLRSEYKAIYRTMAGGYTVERTINGKPLYTQDVATEALLFPLLRIFTGPVIRALAQTKNDKTVCTPDIRTLTKPSTVFQPVLSQRRAFFKRRAEHLQRPADQFDYSGGEYPPGTLFCLDDRDVLLSYEWQANKEEHWRVELVEDT